MNLIDYQHKRATIYQVFMIKISLFFKKSQMLDSFLQSVYYHIIYKRQVLKIGNQDHNK